MNDQQKMKKRIEKMDRMVDLLLTSRYTVLQLNSMVKSKDIFRSEYINQPLFKEVYGEEIVEKIRLRNKKNQSMGVKGNVVFIQEPELVKIVRDDIITVNFYERKILEIVSDYFSNYGSIPNLIKFYKEQYTYNYLWTSLHDPKILNLLKEEYQIKLMEYLNAEQYMQDERYPKRMKLVESFVLSFYRNNGNIDRVLHELQCSKEMLFRVYHDIMVMRQFGKDVYTLLDNVVNQYIEKDFVLEELKNSKRKSLHQ